MKQLFFSFRRQAEHFKHVYTSFLFVGRQNILSMYIIYVLLHLANFVYVEMYSDKKVLKLVYPVR